MTASEPNLPDDFSDVQEISSGSGRLRVFLEVTAAILILVGIYYLFAPKEELDLPPLQQQEIDPIIRAQIDAAQGDQPAAETAETAADETAPSTTEAAPAEKAVSLTDGDAAREIIASQRSDSRPLSELNRLAGEYQQQGRITDAYLLWFYAARQGDGEAAFALATLYDPNHFKPGSSLLTEADATQAYKWYSAAAHQSIPQAAERLQALRATLKAQAETGDLSARRLLLNWQ
ncbi:MAG: deoxyribonuclease [Candidatus Thiodiazotropha sp.]